MGERAWPQSLGYWHFTIERGVVMEIMPWIDNHLSESERKACREPFWFPRAFWQAVKRRRAIRFFWNCLVVYWYDVLWGDKRFTRLLVALEDGRFKRRQISHVFAYDADLPPLAALGVVDKTTLHQVVCDMGTEDLARSLRRESRKFEHPLRVLDFASRMGTRELEQDGPIFTVWPSPRTYLMWKMVISAANGKRKIHIDPDFEYDKWPAGHKAVVTIHQREPW
jgi:hypothetical protein